jgi:hypothetical protein
MKNEMFFLTITGDFKWTAFQKYWKGVIYWHRKYKLQIKMFDYLFQKIALFVYGEYAK